MGNYASDNIRTRQLDAERLFCGCALAASDIARQECAWLSPDIFIDKELGKFWKAVLDGEEAHDIAIRMGIASELVGYVVNVFSVSEPAPYARIIQECAYMRTVLVSIGDVAKKISASDLEGIRKIVSDLYGKDIGASATELASSTAEVVSKEFNIIVDNPSRCVKTYLPALDGPTGGFFSGELILLAGRPGMGKSSLAAQIARNITASGKKVLFVSLEMAKEQLWARMACSLAGCEWKDVRAGDIDSAMRIKIKEESNKLAASYGKNLIIDDESFTVAEIHRLAIACCPDIVIIDQLPEIRWHDPKDTEVRWYGLAAKYLRSHIARSLDIPVLLLHQINRGVEGRDKKRPRLSDLRFSGELEQRADMVLMTYREDYYEGRPPNQTLVPFEIWVMKNRQGDSNVCALLDYDLKGQWFT